MKNIHGKKYFGFLLLIAIAPSNKVFGAENKNVLTIHDERSGEVYESLGHLENCKFRYVVGGSGSKFISNVSKTKSGDFYVWNIGWDSSIPPFYIPKKMADQKEWSYGGHKFEVNNEFTISYGSKKFTVYDITNLSQPLVAQYFDESGDYVGSRSPKTGISTIANLQKAKKFFSSCVP